MSQLRGFRERVCQACGAAWSGRDARFCGHCGAALEELPEPERATADGSPDGRPERWILALLGIGVVVTVATVVGVGGAPAWLESDPREEMSTDVELPEPEEVPDPEAGEASDPEPQDGGFIPGGDLDCEPEGCELWRLEGSMGSSAVLGSVLVHVETTDRPGGTSLGQVASDEDQPSVEAVVTAHSTESGRERWTHVIHEGTEAELGHPRSGVVPVDEDLVLVAIGRSTFALDPESGAMLWSASLEHQVEEAARGGAGEVLLWGSGAPEEVEEAVPEEEAQEGTPDAPVSTSLTMHLTAVEAESGETRWTDRGTWVVGIDSEHLLLWLDGTPERIVAIDLASGDRRWEREVERHGFRPVPIEDGRAAIVEDRQVHVLDIRSGDVDATLELDFDPHVMTTFVGDMLLVVEDPGPSGPAPRKAELHDLADLDAQPWRFDELVNTVVLRDGWATSHWEWERLVAEGLVFLTQDDDVARVEMLDADGSSRWWTRVPLPGGACCARLHAGHDASTVILAPPDAEEGLPQVLSTETGAVIDSLDAPPSDLDEPPMWFRGLAMYGVAGQGERELVLAGPAGHVRVSGAGFPLSGAPIPVLQGERGLIAIDPTLLFADE